jgi:hypothetical protein
MKGAPGRRVLSRGEAPAGEVFVLGASPRATPRQEPLIYTAGMDHILTP